MKNRNLIFRNLLFTVGILVVSISGHSQTLAPVQSAEVFRAKIIDDNLRANEKINQVFNQYSIVEINASEIYQYVRSTPNDCPFQLIIGNKFNWTIDLHENEMRSTDYRAVASGSNGRISVPRTECITYAGNLIDDPNSIVRLNIDSEKIWGYVKSQDAEIFIEPAARFDEKLGKNKFVIYDSQEIVQSIMIRCGVSDMASDLNMPTHQNSTKQMTGNDCRKLEIATESDWEFFNSGQTFADIQANLNLVEGIYFAQFNMKFKIVFQNQWTSGASGDPYTSTTSGCPPSTGQLQNYTNHWNANFGHIRRDINVLYSAKDYTDDSTDPPGQTLGCGFTTRFGNNQDNDSDAYCVNAFQGSVDTEAEKKVLIAHEMGHVLGSGHTTSGIMAAFLDLNANSFSASSITQIEARLNFEEDESEEFVRDDGRSAIRTRYFPTTSPGNYNMVLTGPSVLSANEVILDENTIFVPGGTGIFSFSASDKIILKPGFVTSAQSEKIVLLNIGGCDLLGD